MLRRNLKTSLSIAVYAAQPVVRKKKSANLLYSADKSPEFYSLYVNKYIKRSFHGAISFRFAFLKV